MLLIAMMSLFFVCLVADEWRDIRHAWEDMQIEAMAEIEVEDFEWDEDGSDNSDGQVHLQSNDVRCTKVLCLLVSNTDLNAVSLSSNAQKRGLVRRNAPRKGILSAYYILI